jgi:hypothetical protein
MQEESAIVEGIGIDLIHDKAFSGKQREYLRNRWLHEVQWFARATRFSRRFYYTVSTITVITGALTACTAGLNVLFPT